MQRTVWGGFELQELIGRGSFGEVYRAWDPSLQREIGLKLLLPRALSGEEQYNDLLREARAVASIRHPNIVPVHGVDRHDGLVGFWTDFVHGKTLAALVAEQGPLGYREATLIGIDLCHALSAVHRTGLLHRDIKAENVMREAGGRILLMDFGLSTLPHRQTNIAGTPRYMAPELFAGRPASAASDIFSLGVLLFFLVTGEFPGDGRKPADDTPVGDDEATVAGLALLHKAPGSHASGGRAVLDYRPDVSSKFARVLDTAMQPDPARRFASAGVMASALLDVLEAAPAEVKPKKQKRPWPVRAGVLLLVAIVVEWGTIKRHLFAPAPSTTPSQPASPGANDRYLRASQLLLRYDKRANVVEAIGLLKQILADEPGDALAQAGLGQAYFLRYRVTREPALFEQAKAACNRAIELDNALAPPYVTLARINAMAGHPALAQQEVQKALQLDPRSAEAYGAQAEIYDAEGRGADAIAAVEQAIARQPDNWRWPVLLGNYDLLSGKLQEAASEFDKAAKISPDNSIAWLDLGLTSLQLGHLEDSRAQLEKSAQIEPNFKAYSALSELLTTEGKPAEAIEMSKKALDLNRSNYVAWGNLASAYLWSKGGEAQAMENYRKAAELAEIARKDTPGDPQLLATLGGYDAALGKPEESLALLRQAEALAPDDPNVLFTAGDGYEILHHRSDAIRLISRSLALGFHANQLERSPELASLRADHDFQAAVQAERAKLSLDKTSKTK